MEQAKFWMWTRRNHPNIGHQPLFNSSSTSMPSAIIDNESWEEKAFAKDSSDLLGGCIWPPRSYSCSFCGREFRSAQALGGHMNVHRRDRARMKQSSVVEEEEEEEEDHQEAFNCGEELRLLKRGLDDDYEDDELKRGGKMKRVNSIICTPFFVVPSLSERKLQEPEMINMINPEFVEELDLELRLGDLPKLKVSSKQTHSSSIK